MTVKIVFAHPATGQNYDTLEAAAAVFPGVTLKTLGQFGLVQTTLPEAEPVTDEVMPGGFMMPSMPQPEEQP